MEPGSGDTRPHGRRVMPPWPVGASTGARRVSDPAYAHGVIALLAARLAASRRTDDDLAVLEGHIDAGADEQRTWAAFLSALRHAARNPLLERLGPETLSHVASLDRAPAAVAARQAARKTVVGAVRAGDSEAAEEALRHLLDLVVRPDRAGSPTYPVAS